MIESYKITHGSSILLDLIRGITAQLVVVGHGISFFGIWSFLQPPSAPWMQNIAVLVFFILSGFLITYSTIRKTKKVPNYGFKHFFIDRFARIYTAFIPALLAVVLIDYFSISLSSTSYLYANNYNLGNLIGNIFMLQDFPFLKHLSLKITSFGSARPFWTLAVEWWIYLFFGYLLLVVLRKKRTFIRFGVMFILSIVPFYNTVAGRGNGLFLFWIFGAIIFLLLEYKIIDKISTSAKKAILLAVLLTAIARVVFTMQEYEAVFAFLLAFALLLSIDLSKNLKVNRKLEKAIRFQANFSYTLYLVHYSVLSFIFVNYKGYDPLMLFVIAFLISNLISAAIGYFSEMYLTPKVKKRLYSKFISTKEIGTAN